MPKVIKPKKEKEKMYYFFIPKMCKNNGRPYHAIGGLFCAKTSKPYEMLLDLQKRVKDVGVGGNLRYFYNQKDFLNFITMFINQSVDIVKRDNCIVEI